MLFTSVIILIVVMDIICKDTSPLRFTVDVVQSIESKNWFWLSFRHPVNQLSWILLPGFSHGSMERVWKSAKFPCRDRHVCPLEVFTNTYFSALTMQEIGHFLSRDRLRIHLNFRYSLGGDVHHIYSYIFSFCLANKGEALCALTHAGYWRKTKGSGP